MAGAIKSSPGFLNQNVPKTLKTTQKSNNLENLLFTRRVNKNEIKKVRSMYDK